MLPKLFIQVLNLSSSRMNSSVGSCNTLVSHNFGMSESRALETSPLAIKSSTFSTFSSLNPGSLGKASSNCQFLLHARHWHSNQYLALNSRLLSNLKKWKIFVNKHQVLRNSNNWWQMKLNLWRHSIVKLCRKATD